MKEVCHSQNGWVTSRTDMSLTEWMGNWQDRYVTHRIDG